MANFIQFVLVIITTVGLRVTKNNAEITEIKKFSIKKIKTSKEWKVSLSRKFKKLLNIQIGTEQQQRHWVEPHMILL